MLTMFVKVEDEQERISAEPSAIPRLDQNSMSSEVNTYHSLLFFACSLT